MGRGDGETFVTVCSLCQGLIRGAPISCSDCRKHFHPTSGCVGVSGDTVGCLISEEEYALQYLSCECRDEQSCENLRTGVIGDSTNLYHMYPLLSIVVKELASQVIFMESSIRRLNVLSSAVVVSPRVHFIRILVALSETM